jgi:tetratricopeptide (TPR) repeat protein
VLERASRRYEAAGTAAAAASKSAVAVEQFSAALDVASQLPPSPERNARELVVCLELGPAVQTMFGPAHPRCEEIYRRAVDLARGGAADARAFQALWGYWHFLCMAGRDREAAPYADEIVAMGRTLGDDGLELEACHAALTTQQLLGNAPAMVANAERAIALYDRDRHHHLTHAFGGHDPGICAMGQGAVGLWLLGRTGDALRMADDALKLGESVDHAYSRAVAYYYTAMMYAAAGETAKFRRSAGALLALSDRHGMEMLGNEGRFFVGYGRYKEGGTDGGIAAMRESLATIEATGDLAFVLFYIVLLGEALLEQDLIADADALLDRGLLHAAAGQSFFLPELYRLRGELQRRNGDSAAAVREWNRARELAEQQGAIRSARRLSACPPTQRSTATSRRRSRSRSASRRRFLWLPHRRGSAPAASDRSAGCCAPGRTGNPSAR